MNSEQPPGSTAVLTGSGLMIEPYSRHSFTELKKHYAMLIGKNRQADVFLLKDMTMLADLRASLTECRKRGKTAAALLSADSELPADAALITLQSMGLSAFGLCAENEETLLPALERAAAAAETPLFLAGKCEKAEKLLAEQGFRPIEGYELAFAPPENRETALMLASERQAFFLEPDTTEISPQIFCSDGMGEELFAASQGSSDVLYIWLNTPDDAIAFAENAHMAELPVMFGSRDEISLMLALMLYQGRALVDRTCGLDSAALEKACAKYGAILY